MTRLAVVMSIYRNDRLAFVRESVQSLLDQTQDDFHIYLKLDGPIGSDVREYLDEIQDDRLRIVPRDDSRGLAVSLNELLRLVLALPYEFIARMDADDISEPHRFERQLQYLQEHPDVDCLGAWAIEIDEKGGEYFRKKMPVEHRQCVRFFMKRDLVIHPTVMFRRRYFDKAGLYPEDTFFAEDTMMWAQGMRNGCVFANVPAYLLRFRLDKNFFQRRNGWRHAWSILSIRLRVNRMLGFPRVADFYALGYFSVKLLPAPLLSLAYRVFR